MFSAHAYLVIGVVSIQILYTNACKGCISLDEYSFTKVIPRFEVALVKFDVAYPYGDKHDVFKQVAEEIADNQNIIAAQIGVKDYGEKDNEEYAKKFGVNGKEDLPALRLFVQGEDEPFAFDKHMPWTEENLKKFVRDHTSIYLGLPGCLEVFDKLAIEFRNSGYKESVVKETETVAGKLTTERETKIASTYIKFMKKAIDKGESFITQEVKRLAKILTEGKVNEKKKEELNHRLNILKSFETPPVKSEL